MKIAFLADDHLGYAARCRTHAQSGLNMRVRDGYLAFRQKVTQIIEADVDLVVQGGDLFHRSWPDVSDIVWAQEQLRRFAHAGIPVVGLTGNHDASNERGKSPATAAVNDPDRNITFVSDPYLPVRPVEGVTLHVVSHYGLAQSERLLPEPVDGDINIFTTHGAAMVPGHEVFLCVDSPGEQPVGLDLLIDDRFDLKMLGHYHGMGEVMPDVWYAGSSIRRGFSDPEGGRGWLLITIEPDGKQTVEPQYIDQRPQHDLPKIDAASLTGADVEALVRENLASVETGNAIIRQVIINCSTATRRGIDQVALAALTSDALMWLPDIRRPDPVAMAQAAEAAEGESADGEDGPTTTVATTTMTAAGSADLPEVFAGWIDHYADAAKIPESIRPTVVREGDRHLRAASADVETGADHTTQEGTAA